MRVASKVAWRAFGAVKFSGVAHQPLFDSSMLFDGPGSTVRHITLACSFTMIEEKNR